MNSFLSAVFFFFSITIFSQNSGNWKQVNDNFPDKGIGLVSYSNVSPLDSNKVYILTNCLWYSSNRGESWNLKSEYDPNFVFQKILFDPIDSNKIWAIINSSLYKSLDGGDNWINLNTEIVLNYSKRDQIHIDPITAAIFIYDQNGLRKSTDDGLTWIQILTSPVAEIIMNPLNHNTLYLLPYVSNQIKKSFDGGNTWINYSTPASTYGYKDIDLTKDDTNYVYLYGGHSYGYGSQIALSIDGGQTFNLQTLNTTIYDKNEFNNFSVSQTNKNKVFVGGVECYYSTDKGNTYTQLSSNLIHVDHRDIRRDNFNTIWSSNDGGIYISRNDGLTWINKTNSLNIHITTDLASSETDSSVFLVGLYHDHAKLKKDSIWKSALITGDGFNVAIHPTNPQIIFGKNQYIFYKSFNGGLTSTSAFNSFSETTYGFTSSFPLVFNHQNPNTIYLLSNNVWKGNINSPNLVKISNLPTATDGGEFLYVCSVDSNVIYTKYHNTQNGGGLWTLNPRIVFNVDPDEPNKIWGYNNSTICFSSDGGSTWINLPNHEFSVNLNQKISVANNSYNGIYVYSGSNLYYIDDRLSNWQKFSYGLPKNEEFIKLNVLENFNTVRLSTGYRGIWESSIYTPDTLIADVLNYSESLNINTSCINDTVHFFDNSVSSGIGLGTVYNWNFPGANPSFSTDVNPKVVYSSSGNYPYSLTVSNFLGTSTFYDTIKIGDSLPNLLLTSNNPVCTNDTLFLQSNSIANASYSWSGPFSFNSTDEDPFVSSMYSYKTGVYTCIVDLNGCIQKDTLNISLKPIIPVTASNTGPYCENGTIQLNATTVANATYEWSGPNGFTSNIQNPTIDSVNSSKIGNYTLYVNIDGCRQGPYTTNVSLTTPPTPTSLLLTCTGNTINLSPGGSFSGATQFLWTGPNGFTSTTGITNIYNANQSMSGNYYIKKDGCHILGMTTVVVNTTPTLPIVSNSGPICSGTTVQLFANSDPGVTYQWTGPSFSSTIQNPTLVLNNSGTYQVYATNQNCNSGIVTTSVVVNPSPNATIIGSSTVCSGQTLSLTTSFSSGITYYWTGPNGFTSTLQSPSIPSVTSLNSGVYTLTKTLAGCSGTTANLTVTVNPTPTNPFPTNTGPYCSGNTIFLNCNFVAGATYSWIGPNSFSSTLQNPSIPSASTINSGVYNVKVTKSGCSSPYYNTNVAVYANPNPPIVTSNSPICEGNSIQLNCNTISGATYEWSGPNGFTSNSQNPIISNSTASSTGTYSVRVKVNGCYSSYSTTSVAVNPIPSSPTVSNSGPYCENDTIELYSSTISGASYEWNGPNGFTSNSQNPIISNSTASSSGIYSVRVMVNGCYSSNSTTSVVVNPIPSSPSVSNSGPYCENDTIELYSSTISGATYEWNGPNGFTSNSQNPIISNSTASSIGIYSVRVMVNGCYSSYSTTSVAVNPIPSSPSVSNSGPYCENDTIELYSSTISGASYEWIGPNGFTSNSQNPIISNSTASSTGIYSVRVMVNGCYSSYSTTSVAVNPIPSSPSVSNSGPYCEYDSIELYSSTISGATYEWSGPNGFTSNSQNPIISNSTISSTGIYSVRVIVNGCYSQFDSALILINPLPVITTDDILTFCEGDTIHINSTSTINGNYLWTGPLSFSSSEIIPEIINCQSTHSGMYFLQVESNGCISNTDSTLIIINELPTITTNSDTSICPGATINLIANGGIYYNWNNGLGVGNNFVINPTENSVFIVNGVDLNNCSNSDTFTITIFDEQTLSISIQDDTVCINSGLINLFATPIGGQFSGNGVIGNQFDPNIANIGVNEITYSLTTSDSCQYMTFQEINVVDCAEIKTNNLFSLSIYPNPTNKLISLVSSNLIQSIEIIDIEGRTVFEKTIFAFNDEINLYELSDGIYYILVEFELGKLTEKIILKK